MKATKRLPGTITLNRGRWSWLVRLPGTEKRKRYPLRALGHSIALSVERGDRKMAESIAWQMYEKAKRGELKAERPTRCTLASAVDQYFAYADLYYRRSDRTPSGEAANVRKGLRDILDHHGKMPMDDLSYDLVLASRERMIEKGLARKTINARLGTMKRFAAWALGERLCAPLTKHEIWAIDPLKAFRSEAKETERVKPIKHRYVKATCRMLTPTLSQMVRVQELCGARPSELCAMRTSYIEKKGKVWIYRLGRHKTEHRGMVRVIVFGPRAQMILGPVLAELGPDEVVFSPKRSVKEWNIEKRAGRVSNVQPSQKDRSKAKPLGQQPRDEYDSVTYGRAVRRASVRAGLDSWSPNRLRHACATRVRAKLGISEAAAVLGHMDPSNKITNVYSREAAEAEAIKEITPVMLRIG